MMLMSAGFLRENESSRYGLMHLWELGVWDFDWETRTMHFMTLKF